MWNATARGFFSAVQHNTDPSLLVVRERVRADADTLADWYAEWLGHLADLSSVSSGAFPLPVVTAYDHSDYPWRVIMPRSAWGAFLAETVEDLDYGNFKDAVKKTQGADRAGVYSNVWAALLRLEALDPEGREPMVYEDEEPWDFYPQTDPNRGQDWDWADFAATDPSPSEVTAWLDANQ